MILYQKCFPKRIILVLYQNMLSFFFFIYYVDTINLFCGEDTLLLWILGSWIRNPARHTIIIRFK